MKTQMERTQKVARAYRASVTAVCEEIDAAFSSGEITHARTYDAVLVTLAEKYKRAIDTAVRLDAKERARKSSNRNG